MSQFPEKVDGIVHLAQSAQYRHFPEGASDVMAVNVQAVARLLEYAVRAGASSFIMASSGNVQHMVDALGGGGSGEDPAFYVASKLAAEALALPYGALFQVAILRLWTPYGSGQEGKLIPLLIDRIRQGQEILLDGEDGLVLNPTHVRDVANCFVQALDSPNWRGVIDVAARPSCTLRNLAEQAAALMGGTARFQQTGRRPSPPLVPDLTRLCALIDCGGFMPLGSGLAELLQSETVSRHPSS